MTILHKSMIITSTNTGQERITGDGVVGLSRSSLLTGAPNVIASLWAVPDQSTGELMTEILQAVKKTEGHLDLLIF